MDFYCKKSQFYGCEALGFVGKVDFYCKKSQFFGGAEMVSFEKWIFTVKVPILWVRGARRVSAEFV